ncbi:hypothetical protein C2E23DRAFT_883799 [Lenzites betulinus]|nr:hypothetical protein C2E23DRAFT_883799 [Lenzites betulinus]
MFPPSSRLALRALRPLSRSASKSSNPWPSVQGAPDEQPKARAWLGTASRISNFVIVPTVLLYAVFYADFGDHEHVFQPTVARGAEGVILLPLPEEQKLAGVSPAKPAASDEDTGADRSWCVSSATCLPILS